MIQQGLEADAEDKSGKNSDEKTQAVTAIVAGRRAENTKGAKTFVRARWTVSRLDVFFVVGHGYICGLERFCISTQGNVRKKVERYAHQPTPSRI